MASWLTIVGVASTLGGVAVGRWWVLLVPLAGWPLFYGGLAAGWWLHGVGDGWEWAAAVTTAVSVLGGLVGLAARRSASRKVDRDRESSRRVGMAD